MKGQHTAWEFYFILVVSVILILLSLKTIFNKKISVIKINVIDIFIILFVIYNFIRLFFTIYGNFKSTQFILLILLVALYFVWKEFFLINLKQERTNFLVIILISIFLLSGLVEAILSVLQLYDLAP